MLKISTVHCFGAGLIGFCERGWGVVTWLPTGQNAYNERKSICDVSVSVIQPSSDNVKGGQDMAEGLGLYLIQFSTLDGVIRSGIIPSVFDSSLLRRGGDSADKTTSATVLRWSAVCLFRHPKDDIFRTSKSSIRSCICQRPNTSRSNPNLGGCQIVRTSDLRVHTLDRGDINCQPQELGINSRFGPKVRSPQQCNETHTVCQTLSLAAFNPSPIPV